MITCFRQYDILAKTRNRMTTAITFSRQNEAISRACTTKYCGNLILVVVLVLESKDLCFFFSSFELKPSELESLSVGEMLWCEPFK